VIGLVVSAALAVLMVGIALGWTLRWWLEAPKN